MSRKYFLIILIAASDACDTPRALQNLQNENANVIKTIGVITDSVNKKQLYGPLHTAPVGAVQ